MKSILFCEKRTIIVALTGLLGASGAVAVAAPNSKLTLNGKAASTQVRVIGGKAYVPLADVAKSLGMIVVKSGSGYEIKKAGGTGQVGNLSGKVGDVLFDGKWRFQVLEVRNVDEYLIKASTVQPASNAWDLILWDGATQVMRPRPNRQLVLFRCRVTNGQKTKQNLWTATTDEGIHTALTDIEGGSHIPAAYDYTGAPTQTKPMLPGEILTFSLLFSVPQGTTPKDLVFSLKNNNWQANPTDVRVSLQGATASTSAVEGAATPSQPATPASRPLILPPVKGAGAPVGKRGAGDF